MNGMNGVAVLIIGIVILVVAYLQKRGVSLCLAVCKHHRFHLILRQSDANVKVGNNLTA